MNQASQQSKNLDELIRELKQLWQVTEQHHALDAQAQELIKAFLNANASDLNTSSSDTISAEEFTIAKKVLAKTREKTEALLKQLETLEANML